MMVGIGRYILAVFILVQVFIKDNMQVFLVYETYYDFCNNWETLLFLYADRYMADYKVLELEEANEDEQKSYFVREENVIGVE